MPQPANTPIAPGEGLRHVAGVLQRLPGALEEVPMLRIHDRGVALGLNPKKSASNISISGSTRLART